MLRQLVPLAVSALGLLGCGAVSERPETRAENNGTAGSGGAVIAGDATRADAETPWVPPPIEMCFAAGTPIATPGGERPIEALEVGELVWAFDVEREQRVVARISAVHRHDDALVGRLMTADGRVLRATANHPIYVRERGGFVAASEIQPGETLVRLDDASELGASTVSASGFVADATREPVLNLTVEGVHTYFAGGLLVHNKSPPPPLCPYPDQSPYNCVPPWPPETCFAPGTSIATPSGERAIEALRVGDVVWGYDLDRGARVESRVSAVHVHEARDVGAVVLGDGGVLYATDNHPFYDAQSRRYVPASELSAGSALLSLRGETRVLAQTSGAFVPAATHSIVHNITVDDAHNYFAGGVLVHNKEAPPCPTYDWSSGTGCEHPVVGRGTECSFPSALLSQEAYVAQLNALLFAEHDASGTPAAAFAPSEFGEGRDGRALAVRNATLASLFDGRATFEIGAFLARWLRVPGPPEPGATGTIEQQLYWQLATNLGTLISRPEGFTVAELLAYRESVLTPELAPLYGVVAIDPVQSATLPERYGVLGEIAFLRAHPTPSARGRVLDELFQCHSFMDHVLPVLPPFQLTTRYDAYAQLGTTEGCLECHSIFDQVGLPLELFDELGAYRPVDNGYEVMPRGGTTAPIYVPVIGAEELGNALSEQTITEGCVAQSLLEAALTRPYLPIDQCSVNWIVDGMQGRGELRGALLSLLTSPSLRHESPL